jgi:hypothetical protein
VRTTIRLDEQLLRDVKTLAAQSGRTLTAVIEDALRAALAKRPEHPGGDAVVLPTFKGTGLQPGVDLSDNGALLDLMERGDR